VSRRRNRQCPLEDARLKPSRSIRFPPLLPVLAVLPIPPVLPSCPSAHSISATSASTYRALRSASNSPRLKLQ